MKPIVSWLLVIFLLLVGSLVGIMVVNHISETDSMEELLLTVAKKYELM